MNILPILSTLRRHKITALLVILEIALSCAIICNAVFLIGQRLERTRMPSGVAEHHLVMVRASSIGEPADAKALAQEDLAALRQIPGVSAAALVNEVPFTNSSWNNGIKLDPNQKLSTLNATVYYGENALETLGTQLVAGRYFTSNEYVDFSAVEKNVKLYPHVVIITSDLANRLWPGQNPLGKEMYNGNLEMRVVGVVKALIRPSIFNGDNAAQWSFALPMRMSTDDASRYIIRVASPAQRQQVMKAAVKALRKVDPHRLVGQQQTLDEIRAKFFQNDRAMADMLIGVIVALLLVTALGIVGLASFWVAQRQRTIGVRRALGATRLNILQYFQTENFLLATIGIVVGMLMAYGINLFLMTHYELPRLPWTYLPTGAVALWLIGQLAVLGPALRASKVPPVVATRSV